MEIQQVNKIIKYIISKGTNKWDFDCVNGFQRGANVPVANAYIPFYNGVK